MDAVTGNGGQRFTAARIRTAAAEGGIKPDDPLGPLVEAMAGAVDGIDSLPERVAAATEPVEARMAELLEEARRLARRPLITSEQIKFDMLPRLVSGVRWLHAIGCALLLTAAFGCGAGYMHWRTSQVVVAGLSGGATNCQDQADGARLCWIPVFERPPPATAH